LYMTKKSVMPAQALRNPVIYLNKIYFKRYKVQGGDIKEWKCTHIHDQICLQRQNRLKMYAQAVILPEFIG
ncbi:hypothetical protein, partial [Legionella pneumophila]|uniref:hypothetical protein n=1 Tax=Legionella pneumophila TaxID=446 RepID=UPI000517EB89